MLPPTLSPFLLKCLSDWGIDTLTDIQQLSIDAGVASGTSAIVCAPTSSGKTLVGELAIASALTQNRDAIYLVSHKALADQKFEELTRRFSGPSWPSVTVGISTGDHEEGDVNARLLIATYEKALASLLAGRMKVRQAVIIADELQLLGDEGRGSAVETLCALFRQGEPHQFVGLTATIENPEDPADWMRCSVVQSKTRDVPLWQTIIWEGKRHTVLFGHEDRKTATDLHQGTDLCGRVRRIVADGFGPVLVFTETRKEASDLAAEYSRTCQRGPTGLAISKQLELFSEPSEASQDLIALAERRVTFHTADLTPDERRVIEGGFIDSAFDVCFATSTLAAGVNFPFRTVIIPKLTYGFGDREGRLFARSDYRNMSGRAGRLGHHSDGHVFVFPNSQLELRHANTLVSPQNDRLVSQLVSLSMRRTVLALIAARAVSSKETLNSFFANTFYWHQVAERNPKLLDSITAKSSEAVDWLRDHGFIAFDSDTLRVSPLGKSTAASGLLPETAKGFVELLAGRSKDFLEDSETLEVGLLHWALSCPEFADPQPSRFLPYPAGKMAPESPAGLRKATLLTAWDEANERVTRCTHAMALFVRGEAERKIRHATGVSGGNVHRLAVDLSWVLDGLSRISGTSTLGCPQAVTNQLSMLARRAAWGVPADALDILRLARRERVPGFGRQRAMALRANGVLTLLDVVAVGRDRLLRLVGDTARADALIAVVSESIDVGSVNFERAHMRLAADLGIETKVSACYESQGTAYEAAIADLLREELTWEVTVLDDGVRQNVPDLMLRMGEVALLIECKTVTKKPPRIGKDEAFSVLQKAADFSTDMKRVTLGKPDFDEHSKQKAGASVGISLVPHSTFMEGVLRVLSGRLQAVDFITWLAAPGVTEISRLDGTPTYAADDGVSVPI